ncbi:MAG: cytochrome c-type biogenesis protein CcmH [Actinomycetota bacterium]|nr:cytochrome c-type biogenesis protein CcmH [Actinomycetota bacterium]
MSRAGVSWLVVLVVAVGSLAASEVVDRAPRTNAERVHALAGDFACPVCQGQSLAESDVPVARTIRAAMRTMVDEGWTDDQVRRMLVDRFGEQVDYRPTGRGLTGLVWILPVVAGAVAVVGVGAAIRRWSAGDPAAADGGNGRLLSIGGATVAGVVLVGLLAGVLVARTAGDRGVSDALTGDIRSSTRTLLAEAAVAAPAEAEELYGRVLGIQPSNVEALAYRGWSRWRTGDREAARDDLDEAVAVDAGYADVRVFRASVRHADGDHAGAAADLMALDGLEAPPIVDDLLLASRLRERIAGGLADAGELLAALELLDSGLDPGDGDRGGDAALLAERGWLLAATRVPELVERGLTGLDEAVAVDPAEPHARAYRAVVLAVLADRPEDAVGDVAAFASLDDPPTDLVDLLRTAGLLVD